MRVKQNFLIISLSLSVNACFYAPNATTGKVTVLDTNARASKASLMSENKAVYAIDPDSKSDSLMAAPSGALSGSSITVPSGVLAIAGELVIEQASPLGETSLAASLNIDQDVTVTPVGAGLVVRPTSEVQLLGPLIITLPLEGGAGLRLRSARANIAVLYKQYIGGGLQDGLIPGKDLQFTDNNTVAFEGFFGAYWLVELSVPAETRVEVKSEEPIVNYQKVAVIAETGIVAESVIVEKGEKPAIVWSSTTISFDEASRTVSLIASTQEPSTLVECIADFFPSTDASSGHHVETATSLAASYIVSRTEAHTVYGRLRCHDEEGRTTVSAWSSSLDVPAVPVPPPEVEAIAETFDDTDFSVWKPLVQSREFLKLVLSRELAESEAGFNIVNAATETTLFSSQTSGSTAGLKRQTLSDGQQLFSFKISLLGQLQSYVFGDNLLSVRGSDENPLIEATVAIRDFTIFDDAAITSFAQNQQLASDGFQAWTSVLANPVVGDSNSGQTRLTNGMLNIINP